MDSKYCLRLAYGEGKHHRTAPTLGSVICILKAEAESERTVHLTCTAHSIPFQSLPSPLNSARAHMFHLKG